MYSAEQYFLISLIYVATLYFVASIAGKVTVWKSNTVSSRKKWLQGKGTTLLWKPCSLSQFSCIRIILFTQKFFPGWHMFSCE